MISVFISKVSNLAHLSISAETKEWLLVNTSLNEVVPNASRFHSVN